MLFNLLIFIILIFVSILACIEDLKKREVYDALNYSLILLVFLAGISLSISANTISPLISVLFAMIFGFAIGYFFLILGLWGGGDTKYLIGFAGSIPLILPLIERLDFLGNYFLDNLKLIALQIQSFSFANEIISLIFIGINILILLLILISLILYKAKGRKADLICISLLFLLIILAFLSINFAKISLMILFIVCILFFFLPEESLNVLYYKKNIRKNELLAGDILDIENSYGIIDEERKRGLSLEQIEHLKKNIKEKNLYIQKPLPLLRLIEVNIFLILPLLIIISSYEFILTGIFLITHTIISFFIGGIIAILILLITYLINFRNIKIKLNNYEKILIPISLILAILSAVYFSSTFALLIIFLSLLTPFIKLTKAIESYLFVSKKNIDKIVPGDWIVEDLYAGNKKIYSKEDFKLGVEGYQIQRLKELSKKYDNLKQILVKDGLAFLPPLFIGFLIIII